MHLFVCYPFSPHKCICARRQGNTKDKECKSAIKMHKKKPKSEIAQKHTQEERARWNAHKRIRNVRVQKHAQEERAHNYENQNL